MGNDEITESHRNSIRSSLFVAEKRLREIKRRLEAHDSGHSTIMYTESDNISAAAKAKILKQIRIMLNEIKGMQEDLHLDISENDSRGYVMAAFSEIWVVLEEITPDKLEAYGKVSAGEKALIGPRVSKLLKQFGELESMLGDKPGTR